MFSCFGIVWLGLSCWYALFGPSHGLARQLCIPYARQYRSDGQCDEHE